jgi:hypothetical protein
MKKKVLSFAIVLCLFTSIVAYAFRYSDKPAVTTLAGTELFLIELPGTSGSEYLRNIAASNVLTALGAVKTATVPWQKDIYVMAPVSADVVRFRTTKVVTLSSIGCIVDPADSSESVVANVQECNSNGDSCVSVLSSTITCGNTTTTGTISDTSLAANVWVQVSLGTVTGIVTGVALYIRGTEAQ